MAIGESAQSADLGPVDAGAVPSKKCDLDVGLHIAIPKFGDRCGRLRALEGIFGQKRPRRFAEPRQQETRRPG